MERDRLTEAAAELSRVMAEHAPATRQPEDVINDMIDQITQPGRPVGNFPPAHVTLTDHGPDREVEARLSHSFQQLTPPANTPQAE